jgi:16S rRNA C967 or C1407 C5-methylase (RsmB/RsmF family)
MNHGQCAAPGGKSIAILQLLHQGGRLVANEPNPARRQKLRAILADYLGSAQPFLCKIAGYDGVVLPGSTPDALPESYFDAVLVSSIKNLVPCSFFVWEREEVYS